ncbi:MAG: EAL domain-containing protein [Chloroflexi bacterium]|nr:EAL domain-containing protein [Chloroflexota bacterium]
MPVLVTGISMAALGLVTLRRERASLPGITFFAMTAAIALWLVPVGFVYSTTDRSLALWWLRACHLGVTFIPATVFLFGAALSDQVHVYRWPIRIGFVVGAALYAIDLTTTWIIHHAAHYYFGYYAIFSFKASWALLAYFTVYLSATLYLFYSAYRRTQSTAMRGRLRMLMFALAIAYLGTVDFLPDYHVPIYPFGYLFIAAFAVISSIAIARYRLVDITPALAAEHVLDAMAEGLLIIDRDGLVRVANNAAAGLWNLGGAAVGSQIAALDERWGQDALARLTDPEREQRAEVIFEDNGAVRAIDVASSKLTDRRGVWVGTVYIIHEITERWHAEQAVRESEERFRSLVTNASDLITVIDPDTTIRYQSPAVRHVLGFEPEATLGLKLADACHKDDRAQFLAAIGALMAGQDEILTAEARVRDSAGVWRRVEFTATDQRGNPAIRGLVLNVRDVTERKLLEDQLRHQALHDPLTGLENRASFGAHLEHAIRRGSREDAQLSVLFVDLDNFKSVNDTLGHAAGDAILVDVGHALRGCVRDGDAVARLGGDEFAILLEDLTDTAMATEVAERIVDALRHPVSSMYAEVVTRASVGVAVVRCREASGDELLRHADIAMYAAKGRGKSRFELYDADMHAAVLNRLRMLTDLEGAVERREFFVEYQPTVHLRSGGIIGAEALVRWSHPVRGLITPLEFIPLAEESGVIIGLGRWVLEQACAQAARWRDLGDGDAPFTMSINVSVRQLAEPAFVAEVADALARSTVDPASIVLELTESVFAQDMATTLTTLRELKSLGVRLAIDDFGTGYSSLSYLHQYPFDILKIDKSFVQSARESREDNEFERLIVELGRSLDLTVVAEGIEHEDQLARLVQLACDLGQGFHLGKPMPAAEMDALLAGSRRSHAA